HWRTLISALCANVAKNDTRAWAPSCHLNARGKPDKSLAFDRQDVDAVLVHELTLAQRVFELHAEDVRRADAALRRQRAAEHRPSGFQGVSRKQILGRAHRGDGTFLVELVVGPGAQHELLP